MYYNHGYEGYGIFYHLIEQLGTNNGVIDYDIKKLSHMMRVDEDLLISIYSDIPEYVAFEQEEDQYNFYQYMFLLLFYIFYFGLQTLSFLYDRFLLLLFELLLR